MRSRLRSLLTLGGVAVAMFLFCAVESMQAGVKAATEVAAGDATLVVYRENRYCPFSSQLPQRYAPTIAAIPGVESVTPMRILVSNCRASLDVVTFRGVPRDQFAGEYAARFELLSGSLEDWTRRSDAALVGESLASRRGIKVGDRFSAAGIAVSVAGIFRSDQAQDQNVAYTHLSFVQETVRRGGTGGVVTQFNVRVGDPQELESVASAIDQAFAKETDPTFTSPEKAFVARAAGDLLELVRFAGWLGWGALFAVFALVANAIVLAVQERVKEQAVLQTLGYTAGLVARLVIAEALALSVAGGLLGAATAIALLKVQRFSLTMEGLNIEVAPSIGILLTGLGVSILVGIFAGLVPAWQVSRREITESFRAV
ncbi:MAG: ABC transporter permease [Planctomycetota bacterium]|jgi:putative ABC transport system permease protein